jgi:PIN domain nuclease of toxin-antitoxin system
MCLSGRSWTHPDASRLDQRAQAALASPGNQVLISAVTVWEIAIKQELGRLKFPLDRFDEIIQRMGFEVLPVLPALGGPVAKAP